MANLGADARILTVNSAGTYMLISETNWAVNAVGRRLTALFANGFYAAGTGTTLGVDTRMAITVAGLRSVAIAIAIFQFAVGDFISAGVNQDSGGNLVEGATGAQSALTVARISE